MANLLADKTAVVLGVVNKWSIAYAIATAIRREGGKLILTCQTERLQRSVDELGAELGASRVVVCDVSKDEDLASLAASLLYARPELKSASLAVWQQVAPAYCKYIANVVPDFSTVKGALDWIDTHVYRANLDFLAREKN